MDINHLYEIYKSFPVITIDSRKVEKDCLFFALKGPNHNGNDFLLQAIENGAAYCICDEDRGIADERVIIVKDTMLALQHLAKKHRRQFDIPFIAITGSNGKTTTKELTHAVLSSTYRVYTTEGNLNNHIGIPLTILKIKHDAQLAVIEMGANHIGEIAGYCTYTMPTHGLITNCGKAHLEGFGSEEGVRKGKGELFDYLRSDNGTAFICSDYPYLVEMSRGVNYIRTYGRSEADVMGEAIINDELLNVRMVKGAATGEIHTNLVGMYNLPNVLAAICIAKTFKVEDGKIKDALEQYVPSNSRSQLIRRKSNDIILDAYNANPSSMKEAVENFANIAGKKVLILGAMMELGKDSAREHLDLVKLINGHLWEKVVLVGEDFDNLPAHFIHFPDSGSAREWFRKQDFNNHKILVKGSRSMQMEKVIEE